MRIPALRIFLAISKIKKYKSNSLIKNISSSISHKTTLGLQDSNSNVRKVFFFSTFYEW